MPDPTSNESDLPEYSPAPSRRVRRAALALAVLLLLGLLASLTAHLVGRSRYAQAVEQFQGELGSEIPDVTPEGLRARLADLAPPTPAEPVNAARWLIAGGKAMIWAKGERERVKELSLTPTDQWTPEQWSLAEELVERNQGGLETMHRAAPLTGSNYGVAYEDLIHAEIPNLVELMNAAHLLNLDARLAFAGGDVERGFGSLDTLSRLDDTLRRETVLIFSLIAHVVEKLLLQGISEVLTRDEPWAESPEITGRLTGLLPTDELLAFSRRMIAVDAAVTSGAALIGEENPWTNVTESWLKVYYFGHRNAARYLDLGRQFAVLVDEPYAETRSRISAPTGRRSPGGLWPAYFNAVARGQAAVSQRRLVRAAVELRQLGLSQGTYPTACPDLEILAAPDPFVGKPLVCEPRAGGYLHLEIPGAAALFDEVSRIQSLWITEIDLPAPVGSTLG